MLARLRQWWAEALAGDKRESAYELALLLAVLLGFYLRINGWLGHRVSFWYDEAMWAQRLLHWPLDALGIRPIGFMWLTRLLVRAFGATEVAFRLLPALGAVGSLLLLPSLLKPLIVSRVLRVLLVLLFAIQPALIDYANEFKPYSLEVLVHLVPLALYLRYDATQKVAWFYGLLAFLPLGFLFAYNLAFAFPGVLLLCLYRAWRSPQRQRLVAATLIGGVLCAATCAGIYRLTLTKVVREDQTEAYWGKKYRVFYVDDGEDSRVAWTARKYDDMAALVGLRRTLLSNEGKVSERTERELGALDRALWTGLSFVGLFALWRKRRDLLLLLFAPLVVVVLANLFGQWPLGAFRTNLFTLGYTLPLIGFGMQWLTPTRARLGALCGVLAVVSLVPAFWLTFNWQGKKQTFTRDHHQRQILAKLYDYRRAQLAKNPKAPPIPLYMDPHTYSPYTFYVREHPVFKERYAAFFEQHFAAKKVNTSALWRKSRKFLRDSKQGYWSVVSSRALLGKAEKAADKTGAVVIKEKIDDDHLILFMQHPRYKHKHKRKKR